MDTNKIVKEIITKRSNKKSVAKFSHIKQKILHERKFFSHQTHSRKRRERRRSKKNTQEIENILENDASSSNSTSVESLMDRLDEIERLVLEYRCNELKNENNVNEDNAASNNFLPKLEKLEEEMKQLKMEKCEKLR